MRFRNKFYSNLLEKKIYFLLFIEILITPISFTENNSNKFSNDISIKHSTSQYGPLNVDFSKLTQRNDIFIVPTKNSKDQKLYLAISCIKNKINITSRDLTWSNWFDPKFKFEYNLIKDICYNYFGKYKNQN